MRKVKNIGTRSLGIRTLIINGRELTGELQVTEYVEKKPFDCNNSYGVIERDFSFFLLNFEGIWIKTHNGRWESL